MGMLTRRNLPTWLPAALAMAVIAGLHLYDVANATARLGWAAEWYWSSG